MATAAEIQATFDAVKIAVEPGQVERLVAGLKSYGTVERLIEALRVDFATEALVPAISYQAALAEQANPILTVERLRREAENLDAKAEQSVLEGAEYAGKAAFRRQQGSADLAENFQVMADARDRCAVNWTNEACDLRVRAAQIEASVEARCGFRKLAAEIVGAPALQAAE